MKTIIHSDEQTSVLALWRGAQAKIWIFDVSLVRMAIRLYRLAAPEVIYVVAIGCTHINGPFSWQDAEVEVFKVSSDPTDLSACRIVDRKAGFELHCDDAKVVRGPATAFEKTFDNFLGNS